MSKQDSNQAPRLPLDLDAAVCVGVGAGGRWEGADEAAADVAGACKMRRERRPPAVLGIAPPSRGEVPAVAVGGICAEAVEYGVETRGVDGGRLAVWVDGRREVLLDVLLDGGGAGRVHEALKRVEEGARFSLLFGVLTNAEVRAGVGGRVRICGEGFGCVAEGA